MAEEFRTPQSANEALLQNILGAENETREPQSVTEYYLKKIWEQGQGGGTKYLHNVLVSALSDNIYDLMAQLTIISGDEQPYNFDTLKNWLDNNGTIMANGMFKNTDGAFDILNVKSQQSYLSFFGLNGGSQDTIFLTFTSLNVAKNNATITDNVITI